VRFFFFQAEDGIRDLVRSRGLGDVYKRQASGSTTSSSAPCHIETQASVAPSVGGAGDVGASVDEGSGAVVVGAVVVVAWSSAVAALSGATSSVFPPHEARVTMNTRTR